MGMTKTAPRRLKAAERRLEAMRLRKAGWTYREIADQLGINHSSVYQFVTEAMAEVRNQTSQEAEEYRAVELSRLEQIHKDWAPLATPGAEADHYAIENAAKAAAIVLKASERRSKLLGLDAPEKKELSGTLPGVFAVPQVAVTGEAWAESAKLLPPQPSTE